MSLVAGNGLSTRALNMVSVESVGSQDPKKRVPPKPEDEREAVVDYMAAIRATLEAGMPKK